MSSWKSAGVDAYTDMWAGYLPLGADKNMPNSDYDYLHSDNYRYQGRWLAYDHEHAAVLVAAALYFALGFWSLGVVWQMTRGWKRFYGLERAKIKKFQCDAMCRTVFVKGLEVIGPNAVEFGTLVAVIGLSAFAGRGSGPSGILGIAASGIVVVMVFLSKRSIVTLIIVFEILEIAVQTYQVVRWSGLDPIELWMRGRDSEEYHVIVANAAMRGDEGLAIMILARRGVF